MVEIFSPKICQICLVFRRQGSIDFLLQKTRSCANPCRLCHFARKLGWGVWPPGCLGNNKKNDINEMSPLNLIQCCTTVRSVIFVFQRFSQKLVNVNYLTVYDGRLRIQCRQELICCCIEDVQFILCSSIMNASYCYSVFKDRPKPCYVNMEKQFFHLIMPKVEITSRSDIRSRMLIIGVMYALCWLL